MDNTSPEPNLVQSTEYKLKLESCEKKTFNNSQAQSYPEHTINLI